MKSVLKFRTSWRRLDSNLRTSRSSQSLDSWEKTWLRNLTKSLGIKDQPSPRPLTNYPPLLDLLTRLWEFLYRTVTKSLESELFPSEELRPEFLNQEWSVSSLLLDRNLKSNLLSNITLNSRLPTLVTMSDSMSKILPSLISEEEVSDLMLRTILPTLLSLSLLRSSLWNIQVRLPMDIAQLSTVELLTLPVNLRNSSLLLTRELERPCRRSLPPLRVETLLWSRSFPVNRWLLKISKLILLLEDLPSETWNRLSESELSKKSARRNNNNLYFI